MTRSFNHPNFGPSDEATLTAITEGRRADNPPDARVAERCQCENPQTYRDEDGELRCLCGRAV